MVQALAAILLSAARSHNTTSPQGATKTATSRTVMGRRRIKIDDLVKIEDERTVRAYVAKVRGGFMLSGDNRWHLQLARVPDDDRPLPRPSVPVTSVKDVWRHDTPTVRAKLFGGKGGG